jgi:hypothetical protein
MAAFVLISGFAADRVRLTAKENAREDGKGTET